MRYLIVYESFKTEDYYVEIDSNSNKNYIEMDDRTFQKIWNLLKKYSLYIEEIDSGFRKLVLNKEIGGNQLNVPYIEHPDMTTNVSIESIGISPLFFNSERIKSISVVKRDKSYLINSAQDDYFIVKSSPIRSKIKKLSTTPELRQRLTDTIFYKCDHFEGLVKFLEDEDIIPKQ